MGYKLWGSGELLTSSDLNNYLSKQAVIVCTSGTRPASPPDGMMIRETDTDLLKTWNGAAWVTMAFDATTNGPIDVSESTSQTGFTNTTPAAGSPVCGLTFVAPPSAKVRVTLCGQLNSSANTFNTTLGFEVRTGGTIGSGTVVWSVSSDRALATSFAVNTSAPAYLSASFVILLSTGFTAGSTYNVRTMHSVSNASGNGTVFGRRLIVEPIP